MADQTQTIRPEEDPRPAEAEAAAPAEDRTHRASNKPLRASPFSWETASRVRAPWRR